MTDSAPDPPSSDPPPSTPPAPTAPSPGWYPDPSDGVGYRWWDGNVWTAARTSELGSEGNRDRSTLGPLGPWLSGSFRLWLRRIGHMLPLLVLFVLWVGIAFSVAGWFALRDTVISIDQNSGAVSVDYGGSMAALVVLAALLPISAVLSYVFKAGVARQALVAEAEIPENWQDSLQWLRPRLRRVVGASLGRSAGYWALGGLFWVAVIASPAFILLFPFVVLAVLFLWYRLAFVGVVAAIGPVEVGPFSSSWRLTSTTMLPLFGRLVLLAILAFNVLLAVGFLATPLLAIAGQGATPVEPTAETIRLNDVLGPSLAAFALGTFVNAIGIGANHALVTVGTTLLYRDLGGSVDEPEIDESDRVEEGSS